MKSIFIILLFSSCATYYGHDQSGQDVWFKRKYIECHDDTLYFQPLYYRKSNVIVEFKQVDTVTKYWIKIDTVYKK